MTLFVTVVVFLGMVVLTSKTFKSIKMEYQLDAFDLSAPTTFDSGFLVFKSKGDKCAMFFAVALSLSSVNFTELRRTFTILLKTFPQSSVFSLEWVTSKECYASFYFKVNKDAIVARSKELVDSIQTSFKLIFGDEHVRLLNERELLSHLVYGIPGKIQKASSVDRFSVKLETDTAQHIVTFSRGAVSACRLKEILREITENETYRVILSVRKTELPQSMALCLNITSSTLQKEKHTALKNLVTTKLIQRAPASRIIRCIGDILVRNFPEYKCQHVSFEAAVKEMASFVKESGICFNRIRNSQPITVEPQEPIDDERDWREVLETISEELELRIEKNVFLSVQGFPLRIDAKIHDIFLKTIPQYYSDIERLRWLLIQLADVITQKVGRCVILLPNNPETDSLIEKALSESSSISGIQSITSKRDLQTLLLRCKTDQMNPVEVTAEAV